MAYCGTNSQGLALVAGALSLSVSEASCHKTLLSETHLCAMRIPFVNSVRQEPEGHLLCTSFMGLQAAAILSPDLKVT